MNKFKLKSFCLILIAALGLTAILALTAQAVDLTDGGKEGSFSLEPSIANGTFIASGLHGTLLIPTKNAYILCESGESTEAKGLSTIEILAKIRFLKCNAFNHTTNAPLAACPIEGVNSLGEKGTIDASAIGTSKLHEGRLFVVFTGHAGVEELFAEIKFGPECGIGVKVKVKGKVAAEVDNGELKTEHLFTFSEAAQKLLGTKLIYSAATESFINGLAHVRMSGAYTDYNWAVG